MNNDADKITNTNSKDQSESEDISELISIPKHGSVDDIERVLGQISKVTNALASRVLLGSLKEPVVIGAASPIVQHIFQCAAASGAAVAMIKEHRQRTSPVLMPQMGTPRMGRA